MPAPTDQGFLLPNGWTLKPAGRPVSLADLPLNIIALADNRHALAATSGYNAHELSLIDLAGRKSRRSPSRSRRAGSAWRRTRRATGSGGRAVAAMCSTRFGLTDHRLTRAGGPEPDAQGVKKGDPRHFRAGVALDPARKVLYSLDVDAGTISALDLADLKELKSAPAGTRPYDVVLSRGGNQLFVSDWAGRAVRVLDPGDLRTVARIAVGEHPNQIAVSPDR